MPGQNKYPLLGAHVPTDPQKWVRAEAKRRGISLADMLAEVIDHYRATADRSTEGDEQS